MYLSHTCANMHLSNHVRNSVMALIEEINARLTITTTDPKRFQWQLAALHFALKQGRWEWI